MDKRKDWTYQEVVDLYKQFNPADVDGEGHIVLVAEDSPPMRAIICAALKKKGFDAVPAEDGLKALKALRDRVPDCCLLDIQMPGASGITILESMKKDPKYCDIPVILVTAQKDKNTIVAAQRLGAAGYVMKPFQMDNLIRKVYDCVEAAGDRVGKGRASDEPADEAP